MTGRSGRRATAVVAVLFLATAAGVALGATSEWVSVEYAGLLDARRLSHSGEPVAELLRRLGGRPLPPLGERPADRHAHSLLEPLLEPYAFVMPDALDTLQAVHDPPYVEVGQLWHPGEAQPAWVELLRARRYVVESDGQGTLRAVLPWPHDPADQDLPEIDSRTAAREAWAAAWPILRHAFAAERRRLSGERGAPVTLTVQVHPYRHLPERSTFQLGTEADTVSLDDLRPTGRRPPLDLERLRTFLDSGLRLEGARLDANGGVRLLGSQVEVPPTLLGSPIDLADLAVAYRAVFHGGITDAYMSLDRGYSPMRSIVNYGGLLRDTSLGMVSLLCDIRFKTFSLGIDIAKGEDLREKLRGRLPEFRTHLEALAAHPESQGMAGQQTRLWFYPDDVDLTLSPQGDVLVLRSVRMTAASERLEETGMSSREEVRPWTRATVDAINRDYDALAEFFPEMEDLDRVVRLLSLFAWLKQIDGEGLLVPELESLLAVELPELPTPRTYPQLLAFNALPPAPAASGVVVYDRVPVGEALDRLYPSTGRPLSARRRYQRAVGALDPSQQEHAALLRELEGYELQRLDDVQTDLLAQRAERVKMHQTVLATLEMPRRLALGERMQRGERLRMFSVGIGGLDLGMGPAVERARGRSLGMAAGSEPDRTGAAGPAVASREAREAWRKEPAGLTPSTVPAHGQAASRGAAGTIPHHRVEIEGLAPGAILTLYGADGPEASSRRVQLDGKRRAAVIERLEEQRLLRYELEASPNRLVARPASRRAGDEADTSGTRRVPSGLVLLHLDGTGEAPSETPALGLRLEWLAGGAVRSLEAKFPRKVLQRLVLGREVDLTPAQPLPGLAPLPPSLGDVQAVMVVPDALRWKPPWQAEPPLLAGEEDPLRVARALGAWWSASDPGAPGAVVGVDPAVSAERWLTAPRPERGTLLLLPQDGFDGPAAGWADALADAWGGGHVGELPAEVRAPLVVLISAETPGRFAERLRALARDDRMRGRLLAAWCLAGPIREDLAGSLLSEGVLGGLGVAENTLVARREAVKTLSSLRAALASANNRRAEQLPGPFLWHF